MASAWLEVRLIGSPERIQDVLSDFQGHGWEVKADSGTQAVRADKDGKARRHLVIRPEPAQHTDNPHEMEDQR